MEASWSAYLYTVATVSMTYVAFTMIFVFVRQAMGGALTRFELYSARNFVKVSFIVVAGALLPPPLLALLQLPEPLSWRLSSAAVAAMLVEHAVSFPRVRRAITGVKMPPGILAAMALLWAAAAALVANAAGVPAPPGPGPFALGLTLALFVVMWAIVRRIDTLVAAPDTKDWDPTKG